MKYCFCVNEIVWVQMSENKYYYSKILKINYENQSINVNLLGWNLEKKIKLRMNCIRKISHLCKLKPPSSLSELRSCIQYPHKWIKGSCCQLSKSDRFIIRKKRIVSFKK